MKKEITTLKVAGTYIGTIVGAGFASGQEMLQFFTVFGIKGYYGLLVVTLLFIFFGYIVMELGQKLKAPSHLPIIRFTGGRYLGTFADAVITFFLFGGLTAMIAGSGALFSQEFHIHPLAGNAIMAVITLITVLSGFSGMINAISLVVPFLILSAAGVSIASFFVQPKPIPLEVMPPHSGFLRNWLWSAVIYTSYNTVTAIAILGPLGAQVQDKKTLRNGAILGGLGLGIGAFAILAAMEFNLSQIYTMDIPMIAIARRISPTVRILYAIVLLAEIYTTAVGSLYGFCARLAEGRNKERIFITFTAIGLAFGASLFGFSNLVKYLYPAVGYLGVIILGSLVFNRYKA